MSDLLSSTQRLGVDWLVDHPRGYLADPAGYGKTRQLLTAAAWTSRSGRIQVICPAAIRDTKVWQDEARVIGWDGHLSVMSYHQASRQVPESDTYILDEAHHVKNRKVSWGDKIHKATRGADQIWLASGDPTPNGNATELWGQLRMIREMPSYWKWVGQWFDVFANAHSRWNTDGDLIACGPKCDKDCEHWTEFYEQTYAGLMLRRPASDLQLPPLVGSDQPRFTPMSREQARVYADLRDQFLADLPNGVTLEALNESAKFVAMRQVATALSTHSPQADPDHKQSGKIALLAEQMSTPRPRPTLIVVFFKDTGAAAVEVCQRLGLRVGEFSRRVSARQRRQTVAAFQAGELDAMVASVSMVAEGLNLQTGGYVEMIERHYVPSKNRQAINRLHRRGQTGTVHVTQYVTPDSVDQVQWGELDDKEAGIGRLLTRAEVAALI